MQPSLTVGQLKQAIKDLPDDLPVYASNPLYYKRVDDSYYLNKAEFVPKSSISSPHLSLELGDEFGW